MIVPYSTQGVDSSTEIEALGSYAIFLLSAPGAAATAVGKTEVSLDLIRSGGRVELGFVGKTPEPERDLERP